LPRYRFRDFVLSPSRRLLIRGVRELPLIPRYFDLLVLLVERRHEAVHRREIFDHVWQDVIVSDSALSQAVRTIRRALGDNPREPLFIRTVSRHGYRFVCDDVAEESDDGPWPITGNLVTTVIAEESDADVAGRFESLLDRICRPADTAAAEEQREAAEVLHTLGTDEALRRLGTRPGHPRGRALLRDTRWDVAGAGAVPLLGRPGTVAAATALIGLRLRRTARMATGRMAGASVGGGLAGVLGGVVGGVMLTSAPGSSAPPAVAAVLGVLGGGCGALGAAGVGAGLAVAETVARSQRPFALLFGAAAGGGFIGAAVQWLGRSVLATLVGLDVPVGGAIEGLVIGASAGLGYALATAYVEGGLAAPRGPRRLRSAAIVAGACALGALALTLAGRPLVGGTVHEIAQVAQSSNALLTPLARLLGEPDFGPVTRAVIGSGEAALFGAGLALGLTQRPSAKSH
jgi:DNA-binding winged helix-turn-helix (wHTH) protein